MPLFLTIALVHLLALASPGPDFLFVSQTAASRPRTQALAGVLGIALGIAVLAALALLGLHVLLHRLAWLQRTVAIAGGAYLLWMGFQLLRAAWDSSSDWQLPSTVTEHVRRLRLKLEADPDRPVLIQTVRGVGYRFVPPGG